jgi:hypothetical protein
VHARAGGRFADLPEEFCFASRHVAAIDARDRPLLRRAKDEHCRPQLHADIDDHAQVIDRRLHAVVGPEDVQFGAVEEERLHGPDGNPVVVPESAVVAQRRARQRPRIVRDARRRDLDV